MNDDKELNEYIEKLPKSVQDFIFSPVFEERINEISKKYSLDLEQSETLLNDVLLSVVYIIDPNDLLTVLKQDLTLSDLILEQIMLDLETRIFEPLLKELGEQGGEKNIEIEKRPEIVPELISKFKNEALDRQKTNSFAEVPRYATNTVVANKPNTIVEKKLNSVTSSNSNPLKYEKDPYREPLE